jgi:hypothetical protein
MQVAQRAAAAIASSTTNKANLTRQPLRGAGTESGASSGWGKSSSAFGMWSLPFYYFHFPTEPACHSITTRGARAGFNFFMQNISGMINRNSMAITQNASAKASMFDCLSMVP